MQRSDLLFDFTIYQLKASLWESTSLIKESVIPWNGTEIDFKYLLPLLIVHEVANLLPTEGLNIYSTHLLSSHA